MSVCGRVWITSVREASGRVSSGCRNGVRGVGRPFLERHAVYSYTTAYMSVWRRVGGGGRGCDEGIAWAGDGV